jgi:hypothetical protein
MLNVRPSPWNPNICANHHRKELFQKTEIVLVLGSVASLRASIFVVLVIRTYLALQNPQSFDGLSGWRIANLLLHS